MDWNTQAEQMATVYSRRDKSVEHKRKKKQKKEAVCLHLLKDVGEMYTVNLPPL